MVISHEEIDIFVSLKGPLSYKYIMTSVDVYESIVYITKSLPARPRSLREPGGPCTKSMEVSESRMERVKCVSYISK